MICSLFCLGTRVPRHTPVIRKVIKINSVCAQLKKAIRVTGQFTVFSKVRITTKGKLCTMFPVDESMHTWLATCNENIFAIVAFLYLPG